MRRSPAGRSDRNGRLRNPPRLRSRRRWSRRSGLSVWLLGAVVMGARLLVGHRRMTRLRATAVPAEPGAEALCRDLAARIGVGTPAVLRSPFLFSPCLDGLRRPAILLPEDVGDNLRETFVHELAHLARRDGLWNLLRRSSVAALWVQPLLWVLSRRLEAAAEEVCDDYVVQFGADRARYAGHLLELAGRALPPVSPAGVGMVSLRSMLARRIVRLLDTSRSLSTRAGTRAVLAMLAAGLAGTLFAGPARRGQRSERGAGHRRGRRNRHRKTRPSAVRSSVPRESRPGATVIAWRRRRPAAGTVRTSLQRGRNDALRIRQKDRGRRRPLRGDVRTPESDATAGRAERASTSSRRPPVLAWAIT